MIYQPERMAEIVHLFLQTWERGRFIKLLLAEEIVERLRPDWDSDRKLFNAIQEETFNQIIKQLSKK